MAKITETGKGNVVRDFMIGGTRIKICDDYCRDKTKEEIDEIIRNTSIIAQRAMNEQAARKALQEGECNC